MMSDSLSLSSYKDYPVIHPFINTHTPRHTLPSKAFPESSSTGKVTLILCVCVCVCLYWSPTHSFHLLPVWYLVSMATAGDTLLPYANKA